MPRLPAAPPTAEEGPDRREGGPEIPNHQPWKRRKGREGKRKRRGGKGRGRKQLFHGGFKHEKRLTRADTLRVLGGNHLVPRTEWGLDRGDAPRPILTPTELIFYRGLIEHLNGREAVQCKMRATDVLPPHRQTKAMHDRYAGMHFDFVICDPATLTPRLIIELDDASHGRPGRAERDARKDGLARIANLGMRRVGVGTPYDFDGILGGGTVS